MSSNKIKIENLNKSFNSKNKNINVFKNLNLEIDLSNITVILGKSGCGKTTLIRCISDLESFDSGSIKYISNENFKPKVGMVFQESRLMPWLSVKENILIHSKEDKDIKNILTLLKLDNIENSMPYELSGGMAHRVSIGRALAFNPNILIMDEPFAALDYFTRIDLQKEVINIFKKTNIGIIFVTHNIEEALSIATKIVIMKNDNSIESFSIEKDFNRNLSSEYFVELKIKILNCLKET